MMNMYSDRQQSSPVSDAPGAGGDVANVSGGKGVVKSIRLYNALILSMKDGEQIFEGEIHVKGNRITYIGGPTDGGLFDEETDCCGNLLMPGFKNAHAHSAMSVLRSRADDMPLMDWLTRMCFPVEARMTAEDIYWLSQLSVLEYLTSGITACADMYFYPESIARAMNETGFRCAIVPPVSDMNPDLSQVERFFQSMNKDPESLTSFLLGLHAEYTTGMPKLLEIAALAKKHHAPVFCHACETASEVEDCRKRYGMTPIETLVSTGMFDCGGAIYHGVHLTDHDMELLKQKDITVVSCPASNLKLASGIAPVCDLLNRGIRVGIGTDGPASNNSLDMFKEMYLVAALAKVRENDAAAIDAVEVLKMATVNGARAMLLDDCDVLAAGKKADIIMIDLSMPNMQPINNIEKNIIYACGKINVRMTMIDGVVRYRDGQFYVGRPVEQIYRQVEAAKERLFRQSE